MNEKNSEKICKNAKDEKVDGKSFIDEKGDEIMGIETVEEFVYGKDHDKNYTLLKEHKILFLKELSDAWDFTLVESYKEDKSVRLKIKDGVVSSSVDLKPGHFILLKGNFKSNI